ncbi:hypothetical protein IKW72_08105 [bacterium]|nr:hypothetical protein [bacterium]
MKFGSFLIFAFVLAASQLLLIGCANPYADSYTSYVFVSPSERNPNPVVTSCAPEAAQASVSQYLASGYELIGRSEFYDNDQYMRDSCAYVRAQATNVCADVALYWTAYSHTEDQSYEEDVPREEKITTYHSNGKKTKTVIESTETRYVQKFVNMYRYCAAFFKRRTAPPVAVPVN